MTIRIRTDAVVFLCHWVDGRESSHIRVHEAGTVVVPVEAVDSVILLSVVLVFLRVAIGALSEKAPEWIVVVRLFHRPGGVAHHAVAAKVVFQIIVIYRRGTAQGDVAAVNENVGYGPVGIEIVGRVVERDTACQVAVTRAKPLASSIVPIFRRIAVPEIHILRQI